MAETLAAAGLGLLALLALLRFAARSESAEIGEDEYRERAGAGSRLGNALLSVQALLEPARSHPVAERSTIAADAAPSSGQDPDPEAGSARQ